MDRLLLRRDQYEQIIAQCRAARPHEACGMIFGRDGVGEVVAPMENIAASSEFYQLDPLAQMRLIARQEDEERELTAIYHSHVASPARPSATDIELAFYEDSAYLIISLRNEPPEGRAFQILVGAAREIPLEFVESEQYHER